MNRFCLPFACALWIAGCNGTPETLPDTAPPLDLETFDFGPWKPLAPAVRYAPKDLELALADVAEHCVAYAIEEAQVLRVSRGVGSATR